MPSIERHDVEWRPSIIIGWRHGDIGRCGPHQTPFTGTGFAWCYGWKKGQEFDSFDFETGEFRPVEYVLPLHGHFSLLNEPPCYPDLTELEQHIAAISTANEMTACEQALLANQMTIAMANARIAGAPGTPFGRHSHDDTSNASALNIIRRDCRPIAESPPKRFAEVHVSVLFQNVVCHLDPKSQILWLAHDMVPLIDCPGLKFDQILRSQLKAAYPEKPEPWAIVSCHAVSHEIEASRRREFEPDPSPFIVAPHAVALYPPKKKLPRSYPTVEVTILDKRVTILAGERSYSATAFFLPGQITIEITDADWPELAGRPDIRLSIVKKVRKQYPGLLVVIGGSVR